MCCKVSVVAHVSLLRQVSASLQPKEAEPSRPPLEPIPDIEWWDARICADGASYDSMAAAASEDEFLLRDKITNLVSVLCKLLPNWLSAEHAHRNAIVPCRTASIMLWCLSVRLTMPKDCRRFQIVVVLVAAEADRGSVGFGLCAAGAAPSAD